MNNINRQDWFGALVAVVALGLVLSVASPYFLTAGNLSNVLVKASVIALLAGAQTFVILTSGVDLSVGAVTALAGAIAGHLMLKLGVDPYAAIAVALLIGIGVGMFNGYLIAYVGIPSFIVTLGGLTLWRGLAFESTGGFDNSGLPDPFPFIGYGEILGIPMPILIMLLAYVVMAFVLSSTRFGRHVYAIGSNAAGARQVGINIRRSTMGVYVVSGFVCALAAIVLMARMDSSSGRMAMNFELDAIAAVILGGTSLFGGRGSIWGSLLGAILITMIRNGMNLLEISQFKQMMAIGAVVILAVWIDVIRRKRMLR
ncbi:ribose/xylose/arabinose/galactoside ABC-type transport systems, permease component [Serpentinimonas maccroryi]|uniref:Ribose/xylose/arabinose/galactoside ABC-type transport systems, permease component n=1 Tax=Serpentinimonas maccroryi TaxID=1458426 RepID=A0A060NWI6_9BURK|nr:ribose/xylose/arabinose/galactoside ABC-type transport systems, permease component [Serpentinimonas maccroryi]